jgi:SAM-dependent methyltransferase
MTVRNFWPSTSVCPRRRDLDRFTGSKIECWRVMAQSSEQSSNTTDRTVVLPRVVQDPPGKPRRPGASETQAFARRIAEDPSSWGHDEVVATASRFDILAESWDEERASYRATPLSDALTRGGPWPDGLCVEIGSGTGVLTPLLLERWQVTLCLDLSAGMLGRARTGLRVRADASRLPIPSNVAAAIVVGDAPLFAEEVVRVLGPHGVVIWVNALGADAPYWVPTETIRSALARASAEPWGAVVSKAGWGSWVVLRRAVRN